MCGRYAIDFDQEELEELLGYVYRSGPLRQYNITPDSEVPAVVMSRKTKKIEVHAMRWGLIPDWKAAKSKLLFNARLETVAEKPVFKPSFESRRCILPARAFYEWERRTTQPFVVRPADGLFAFAGIWRARRNEEGEVEVRCSIITTKAPESLSAIHERSPAIIGEAHYGPWLDPAANSDPLTLLGMPRPPDNQEIICKKADARVNNPSSNDITLVEGVAG